MTAREAATFRLSEKVETLAWTGSHHDLAMQNADEVTVKGDFDDAEFTYAGVTTTFFRAGGRFIVRTDGHVPVNRPADATEHLLLDDPVGLPEGLANPLRHLFVVRHLTPGPTEEPVDPGTLPQVQNTAICAPS